MTDSQKHRGPDHRGLWMSDEVCLGHNRLSIIDLSEDAHQPFACPNNRCQLVFNGEIYNFKEIKKELILKGINFRTSSDTEVVLEAYKNYGTAFLNKLNGFFAIAI